MNRRAHLAIGLIAIVGLPLASWIEGSKQLAWTMFSLTGSFRLAVAAIAPDGTRRVLAPTELAVAAHGPATEILGGADHWRYTDVGRATAARHLDDLGALGCRVAPEAAAIELRLDERRVLDGPVASRTVRVDCARR